MIPFRQSPAFGTTAYWAARLTAAALVAVIVVLSVVPGNERPHTSYPGQFEHFIAYGGATFLIGLVASRAPTLAVPVGFSVLAAGLEWIQRFIPGRTSQLIDWIASSAGAAFGAVMAMAALWALRAALRSRVSP